MSKKRFFRVVVTAIVLLLLLAAGTVLLFMPKKAAAVPAFSSMPTDTAGYNMIGNLPENLAAGGFMAGQNGWIYFTNFADGGSLYMCRENGADMVKLTDFPVCNINVLGSSVVFTGLELSTSYVEESSANEGAYFSDMERAFSDIKAAYASMSASHGGKLYAIYGIHSSSEPRFCVIDPDAVCFSPYLDLDGLYAVCADESQSVLANKISGLSMIVTREGESVKKIFSYGDAIYANLFSAPDKKSRIMRIDAQTLFPLDYINGDSLYRVGSSFVFRGEDGFVYELSPLDNAIKPISSVPVDGLSVNAFGEATAFWLEDKGANYCNIKYMVLSKQQRYGDIAQAILSKRKSGPITMQNGWYSYHNKAQLFATPNGLYSYHNADSRHGGLTWFKANNDYYSLDGAVWSAKWLGTKLDTEPLVSLDDLIVEDLFTPTWLDFSEDMEPVDPADGGDFGNERPVRPGADSRADAANDARNALDAAILLLLEDERIADEYTGESVEKLRSLYGGTFEAALEDAASKLSANLSRRSGLDVSIQETRELLDVWLQNTSYEVGGIEAASNGTEAGVMLTVKNPVDVDLFYDMIAEADDAEFSYAEIMREPGRYGFMSSLPKNESAQIYMRMASDDCWIAENPDKLIRVLVRGLD